jgi:LPXTG-site transpeptidase (sortase) family protein
MKLNTLSILVFVVSAVVTIAFSFATANYRESAILGSVENIKQVQTTELTPRLVISNINVNTRIESVGLTKLGAMEAPKSPENVAWYNLGPVVGSIGSAVIAGHFGWKEGIPAVFDNLNKLQIGDRVYVKSVNQEVLTFVVQKTKIYDKDADTTEVFISNDKLSRLNLITCEGVWDKDSKVYSDRLVVFTVRAKL